MVRWFGLLLLTAIAVVGFVFMSNSRTNSASVDIMLTTPEGDSVVVAAPGWVEPRSEEIRLSASLSGRLQVVSVDEGDQVSAGQIVANTENAELVAALARAEATLRRRQAELERLQNGARGEERAEAAAAVRETAAALRTAQTVMERRRSLLDQKIVAREQFDEAEREFLMARARHEAEIQRQALIDEPPRAEDVAIAEAELAYARAAGDEARAMLEKSLVRSPIDGVVLRKYRHSGETVLTSVEMPIVTVGDVSRLNVRADVDERDIARVSLGQRVYVSAAAFGDERFWGTVIELGRVLGRKTRRTDEPKERTDTKILEVLIELDRADRLLPGLRVDTYFVELEAPPAG